MKLALASALALGLATLSAAQAMPVAPIDRQADREIIQVAQGCGPGFHRGPYGYCRPLYSCPPGWRPGPYGRRCFPVARYY